MTQNQAYNHFLNANMNFLHLEDFSSPPINMLQAPEIPRPEAHHAHAQVAEDIPLQHNSDPNSEHLYIQQRKSSTKEGEVGSNTCFQELMPGTYKESHFPPEQQNIQFGLVSLGRKILEQISSNLLSLPFRHPVDPYEDGVQDYHEVVKEPMDLQTMRLRLEKGKYKTKQQFYSDLDLIVSNSRLYHENSPEFLAITKKFQNLCTKVRRAVDPHGKKRGRQITHRQTAKAEKKIQIKKERGHPKVKMTISEMPHECLSSDKIEEEFEKVEKIEHHEISSNH